MPEPLTSEEIRVLGSLMEMQISTPNAYPPSLAQLMNVCNKKVGRHPVTDYRESQIQNGLDMLEIRGLVETVEAEEPGTYQFLQTAKSAFTLSDEEAAVFCVLLLRGPRSLDDIYTEAKKLYDFASPDDVEETLHALSIHEPALVTAQLDPSGNGEFLYNHLLGEKTQKKKPAGMEGLVGARMVQTGNNPVSTGLSEDLKKYFSLSMSSIRAEIRALRREVEALRRDLDR